MNYLNCTPYMKKITDDPRLLLELESHNIKIALMVTAFSPDEQWFYGNPVFTKSLQDEFEVVEKCAYPKGGLSLTNFAFDVFEKQTGGQIGNIIADDVVFFGVGARETKKVRSALIYDNDVQEMPILFWLVFYDEIIILPGGKLFIEF